MIQLIEIMLHRSPEVTTHPPKLFVNPEDVSHLYSNEHNKPFIVFRNGKQYQLFDGIETVRNKLQLKA